MEPPTWNELPGNVQEDLEKANLSRQVFDDQLGRRRGDVLNFYAALGAHRLWERMFIVNPRQEMGSNGIRFQARPNGTALLGQLRENPKFTDLTTTWRGRINCRLHPEKYNFSENRPHRASLHFTFNHDGPQSVHFDYFNAHTNSLWPLLGHTLVEYPYKFWREFSNAADIRRCLNQRFHRDVWKF